MVIFRLGHLSNQRMKMMHSDFPSILFDEGSVCDICHYARQKKLFYNLSTNRASKCYELIHFDIWGPISTPPYSLTRNLERDHMLI